MSRRKPKKEASALAASAPLADNAEKNKGFIQTWTDEIISWTDWIGDMPNFLKELRDYLNLKSKFNKYHDRVISTLPPVRVFNEEELERRSVDGSKISATIATSLAEALTHKIDN